MYDTLNGVGSFAWTPFYYFISNVGASHLGKFCRSPILSLFLVANFSQMGLFFLFVDCDQHGDKGDEVGQEKISAADWKWCIAL